MIETRDLVKNHNALRVLDGVSLTVGRGEVAVIIGPSGGGKSTLLRCINGLEAFQQGEVRVDDIVLRPNGVAGQNESLRQLRRRVGMVFQQFHLFPHLQRVGERHVRPAVGAATAARRGGSKGPEPFEARGTGRQDRRLAGAVVRRPAAARRHRARLAMKPDAILFDEPTSALDPRMAGEVLARYRRSGRRRTNDGCGNTCHELRSPRGQDGSCHARGPHRRVRAAGANLRPAPPRGDPRFWRKRQVIDSLHT